MMEKIIYFITAAMVLSDLDTYMFAGMNAKWVYLNLEIVNYSMYLLKYLYLTVFTLFIMKESGRFVKIKKALLAVSILCGIIGMVCISLPDIREEFYYFSSDNYFYYGRLYDIIRVLLILDILVLLVALLLERKRYSKKTFHLYLVYVCLLTATAFLDYVIDTWYLQNLAIFFSSMIPHTRIGRPLAGFLFTTSRWLHSLHFGTLLRMLTPPGLRRCPLLPRRSCYRRHNFRNFPRPRGIRHPPRRHPCPPGRPFLRLVRARHRRPSFQPAP